jgi:hypothetical protein
MVRISGWKIGCGLIVVCNCVWQIANWPNSPKELEKKAQTVLCRLDLGSSAKGEGIQRASAINV